MDEQEQRRLAALMTVLTALLTIVFMPYFCRLRNRHEPAEDAVSAFLDGGGETMSTKCSTCGCDLELCADPDDEDLYWIVEL